MIVKAFCSFSQKKSEAAYKRWLQGLAVIFFSLGSLGLVFSHWAQFSDFGSSMLLGLSITCMALSIYYFTVLQNPKKRHALYVRAYDERNKQILMATALATLVLQCIIITLLLVLFAFADMQLTYPSLLSLLLYSLVLGFLIFRLIISKLF